MNWVEEYEDVVVVFFVVVFARGVGSVGWVVFVFGFFVETSSLFRKLVLVELEFEKLVVISELIWLVSVKLGVVELDSKIVLFSLKMSLSEICLSKNNTFDCCFELFGLTVSLFA